MSQAEDPGDRTDRGLDKIYALLSQVEDNRHDCLCAWKGGGAS